MKDTLTSTLSDRLAAKSSGVEDLLKKIPGFGGYFEKGQRREADRLLRVTLANQADQLRIRLGGVQETLGRDILKAIDHAEPMGQLDSRLMGLSAKIRDAAEGYAGFLDAIKIEDDDLARIYAFDDTMLEMIGDIEASITALEQTVADDGDIAGTIRAAKQATKTASEAFAARGQVLLGIS